MNTQTETIMMKSADILVKKEEAEVEARRNRLDNLLLAIAIIIFVSVIFLKVLGMPCSIDGSSMEPTYSSGQTVFALRPIVKAPGLGDVVVVRNINTNNEDYIKRLEGVPGDTLVIRDGILFRNGSPVEEGFELMEDAGWLEEEYTLNEDEYFVLGDNRNDSEDSRYIGPVETNDIRLVIIGSNNR